MKKIKIKLNRGNKEYDVEYTVDNGVVTLRKITQGEKDIGFYSIHNARLIYKRVCEREGIRHREGIRASQQK